MGRFISERVVALNSDRGDAERQTFAEASARDNGIQRTRNTRNSPIVRAASPHRSRFAHRPRDDHSRDNVAQAREPQGSASRLSIASGWVRDPCGVQGHPHSRARRQFVADLIPCGNYPVRKPRHRLFKTGQPSRQEKPMLAFPLERQGPTWHSNATTPPNVSRASTNSWLT